MTRTRHRLLLVDDQPANIRVLAEALKGDHDLVFATSGERAIEMAGRGGIDLVLLDVVMPELGGFEVCRRLKEDPRTATIPVVFVTASEETEDETRGFDLGAVDYITKPIRPPIVRARVRTHLELKEARDLLERMAMVDALTGIANRRRLDLAVDSEWQRAARAARCLSLALVDVDEFKRFNDAHGHARGDEALRDVARALTDVARRPGDLVARYGGEEFAVLLPDTDAEGMRRVVRTLLARVEELAIPHAASTVAPHVTVSVGAATVEPAAGEAAAAFELVDSLLYDVKRSGRAHGLHLDHHLGVRERLTPALEGLAR